TTGGQCEKDKKSRTNKELVAHSLTFRKLRRPSSVRGMWGYGIIKKLNVCQEQKHKTNKQKVKNIWKKEC
ncbi:MAG: hypothetical protein RR458_03260, partial [Clostridia bacterium]